MIQGVEIGDFGKDRPWKLGKRMKCDPIYYDRQSLDESEQTV
jgi:hypothetical protein